MNSGRKRTEKEVVETVLDYAEKDGSVRAVIRTNLFPKREYDYYNFCFVADDPEKYNGDIFDNCFGERILLYRGDRNYPDLFQDKTKAHLMVFGDGTTIAINVMGKEAFLARYNREQTYENVWIGDTYLKILDKDNMLPEIERLDEKQTWFAGTPTAEEFGGILADLEGVRRCREAVEHRRERRRGALRLCLAGRYGEKHAEPDQKHERIVSGGRI